MKRLRMLSAGLLLLSGASQAAVMVSGDVANPGPVELPPGGRLLDVISVVVPNAEGYWLAGVLLRQSLLAVCCRQTLTRRLAMPMLMARPDRRVRAVRRPMTMSCSTGILSPVMAARTRISR